MKKRILIIYAPFGAGHRSIANNIKDYFLEHGNYEIMMIDIFDYSKKYQSNLILQADDFSKKYAPFLHDFSYKVSDNKIVSSIVASIMNRIVNSKEFNEKIIQFNPDIVIATHFLGATYVGKLKKEKIVDPKLISIVTDYKAHQLLLLPYKSENALIVNSVEEKKALVKTGISPSIIKTFGIPLSSKYSKKLYNREKLRKKFGFTQERLSILFYGGGGGGLGFSLPYLKILLKKRINVDIVFVCGKNEELKNKALELAKSFSANNIKVLGFITNVPEYLCASDFVISKPGGITITECLCFEKPMILIKGNGGQENDNYKYLVKKGYAINAIGLHKFSRTIDEICTNEDILENMRKKLKGQDGKKSMEKLFELVKKF